MRPKRAILGFLLVYQAVFLNVVLPGHTRGAVTLDGKHTAGGPCCCCGGDEGTTRRPVGQGPAGPSRRDRDHCAICSFAARVTPPPAFDFRLPPLGLLERLPPPVPATATSVARIRTYLACGPPPAHA